MNFDKLQVILDYCHNSGISLKKAGDRWLGLCPIHGEKTPSFWIYPDGHFKCFGCGESGDAFDLYLQINPGSSFIDAKKALGLWEETPDPTKRNPDCPKPKPFPRRFETADKKEAYKYCVQCLTKIIDGIVVFRGTEYMIHKFFVACIRDNPDRQKYINRIAAAIEKRSEIGADLFKNAVEFELKTEKEKYS